MGSLDREFCSFHFPVSLIFWSIFCVSFAIARILRVPFSVSELEIRFHAYLEDNRLNLGNFDYICRVLKCLKWKPTGSGS